MLKDMATRCCKEKGCNCGESTLLAASEQYGLGLTEEDAKLMGGFGGGLGSGLTCGALLASASVLGKLVLTGPAHSCPGFRKLCGEYAAAFKETMGGTNCAELRPVYFVRGEGCVRAIQKNAELLEAFIEEHELAK